MDKEFIYEQRQIERNEKTILQDKTLQKQYNRGTKSYRFFTDQIKILRQENKDILRLQRLRRKESQATIRKQKLAEKRYRQEQRVEARLFYVRPSRKKITLMSRAVQSLGDNRQERQAAIDDITHNIATL